MMRTKLEMKLDELVLILLDKLMCLKDSKRQINS